MEITLKKDLIGVKEAKLKKQILGILKKWLIQVKSPKFVSEFLSDKNDKYFREIKKAIGEFKGLNKMDVLCFLFNVIVVDNNKTPLLRELHEEYKQLWEEKYKKKWYRNFNGD